MKVDELRVLEADELGVRLRTARRELYELRFKHAVGQLENSAQIKKVRHDIARIMTVLRERDFGIVASMPEDAVATQAAAAGRAQGAPQLEAEAPDAAEETVEEQEEQPKSRRGRRSKKEETA